MKAEVVPELAGFLNITDSSGVLFVKLSKFTNVSVTLPVPSASVGAVLAGTIMIVTGSSTHNAGLPLSVTRTLNEFVPMPGGVQVNTPVLLLIAAPEGTLPVRLN